MLFKNNTVIPSEVECIYDFSETDKVWDNRFIDLVTRGNVAIYCYNALTAKTWDVAESTGTELTSKASEKDTILAKYFSDFTNKAGEMKLVENAKVTVSGATTTAIGSNQVKIEFAGIAGKINAEDKPRRDAEEVTYKVSSSEVVAYVPAKVANIANLAGKTVDVIFGKDNEVAYLVVTDDAMDAAYVTAWDAEDKEITIDGTKYELANKVSVNVFNYEIGTNAAAVNTLLVEGLKITNPAKYMTRNVIAEITVNADDEIETINFKFSADYTNGDLVVSEYIVTEIDEEDLTTTVKDIDIEDLADEDDPRVIRNGEVAELSDIEAGDVITEVAIDGKVITVIAVANTFDGTVADYSAKLNAFDVAGTNYVVSMVEGNVYYNNDGDLEKITEITPAKLVEDYFEDEEVTVYLNMAGEVVAMVAETEATGTIFGVITNDYDVAHTKNIFEDSNDVEYAKIKILTTDNQNKVYKIYNDKTNKNVSEDEDYKKLSLTNGDLVSFEADADRVIKASKIAEVKSGETYKFGSLDKITATKLDSKPTVNTTREYIGDDKFTSSSLIINTNKNEVISNFSAIVDGSSFVDASKIWVFTRNSKVVYVVASIAEYGTSTQKYGILLDAGKNTDDEGLDYVATILVDGEEEVYESEIRLTELFEIGDFITFTVSDNEVNYNLDSKDLADATKALADAEKALADKVEAKVTTEAGAVTTAEENLETAKAAVTKAEEDLVKAEKAVADNKDDDKAAELKAAVTKAEKDLADAKTAVEDAEKDLADAEEALEEAIAGVDVKAEEAAIAEAKADLDVATVDAMPVLLVGYDFVADLKKIKDSEDIESSNINEEYFAAIYGEDLDYIKVAEEGFDGESIVFENESATSAFLAKDYIVYDLATSEVSEIEEKDYVLLVDFDDEDKEYSIVIIVK